MLPTKQPSMAMQIFIKKTLIVPTSIILFDAI